MCEDSKTITPSFRYDLKALIIKAGYRNLTDFCRKSEIDLPRISRIIGGWELPGPGLQKNMTQTLGITLEELKALL